MSSETDAEFRLPRPAGVPWALLISLLLLLAFEAWIRTRWSPAVLVGYRDGDDQIRSVWSAMNVVPPAEVAFVGSSMTLQGVAVPELTAKLDQLLGRPVRVGNYAIRGGVVDTYDAAVRELLRQPTKPTIIVVGTSLRDFRNRRPIVDRMAELWNFYDWRRERKHESLSEMREALPTVLRNEWGDVLHTLRYRDGIRAWMVTRFVDDDIERSPALGARPSQHEGSRSTRTLADNLNEFARPTNKRRMIQTYRPELPAKPSAEVSAYAASIIAECKAAGVKLIFVDVPISPPLKALLNAAQTKSKNRDASSEFDPEYRATMEAVAHKGGVLFLTTADLGIELKTADFYDGQHLNLGGAVKLSEAMAGPIAEQLGR